MDVYKFCAWFGAYYIFTCLIDNKPLWFDNFVKKTSNKININQIGDVYND